MTELLKEKNYYNDTYFNRKIGRQADYQQAVMPNYDNINVDPLDDVEISPSDDIVTRKQSKLSIIDKCWLIGCVIIAVSISIYTLTMRMDIFEMNQSIDNIEDTITYYQSQTEQLRSQITEQFNYEQIKDAAQNNGMTIDKGRVRTVGE